MPAFSLLGPQMTKHSWTDGAALHELSTFAGKDEHVCCDTPRQQLLAASTPRSTNFMPHIPLQQPMSMSLVDEGEFSSDTRTLQADTMSNRCKRTAQGWASWIVQKPVFEVSTSLVVLLNCVEIGVEADYKALHETYSSSEAVQLFFCIWFCTELACRMCAAGCSEYFCGEDFMWNLFDCFMVGIQLMDRWFYYFGSGHNADLSLFRMVRLIRLLRIARLFRVVHMVQGLKVMAVSMVNAFGALIWTMLLLLMLIYICSIICIECIVSAQSGSQPSLHAKELDYFYGSLGRSMLTLFECIVGGLSWDEAVNPLIIDIGAFMGLGFVFYIVITCYAMTNMMTGMFVQKAMHFATENQDKSQTEMLRDLIFKDGHMELDEISWDDFKEIAKTIEMQEYFKVLNVDIEEARNVFDLLDADGGGSLDPKELVTGCLRLRGEAKALDLCLLMKQVSMMSQRVDELWRQQVGNMGSSGM